MKSSYIRYVCTVLEIIPRVHSICHAKLAPGGCSFEQTLTLYKKLSQK